jgi:hypothetical protein
MSAFKTGVAVAASACALALLVGHGHLGAGFGRLGSDAQATIENLGPMAEHAMGVVGTAMVHSGQAAKQGLNATTVAAQSMASSAALAASTASISALSLREVQGQSSLRADIYGSAPDRIAPSTDDLSAAAARAVARAWPTSIDSARYVALEATARNLLRDNTALRAMSFSEPMRAAKDASALASSRSASIDAFADTFARALSKQSSPVQAAAWKLPEQAKTGQATHSDPIGAALNQAISAARQGKPRPHSAPCPAWALAATPALDHGKIASEALELGGQARLFIATRSGAKPSELASIHAKIQARRAALASKEEDVLRAEPGQAL